MSYFKAIVLSILVLSSFQSQSQSHNSQKLESLVNNLIARSPEVDPQLKLLLTIKNRHILKKILEYKEEAIPYLINVINLDRQYVDYHGEYSSHIGTEYYGIICIKIIEKILNPEFKCEKIYKNGENTKLTLEDMNQLKMLYENWWNKCQQYNSVEFRKYSALEGSIYSWEVCDKEYSLSDNYY